ncbi:hypothetical protein [Nocardioides sp.]|uniref:hypothetical protein n=1 Tax=Nocardioides sp. TaxID=35761 RepID=UPI0026021483|nr:hypothetical protein [Nocardioides sp.]
MSEAAQQTQWFSATSGRVSGITGLIAAVVVVVVAAMSGSAGWIVGGLLIGLAVWVVLLRPRVGLRGRTLLLRGMLSTIELPLSLVTTIKIRQVFLAWVEEDRYVNASLGRPLREVRTRRGEEPPANPYLEHIEELIRAHRADAVRWGDDSDGVRRHWAVRELSAAAVLAVALLVTALV